MVVRAAEVLRVAPFGDDAGGSVRVSGLGLHRDGRLVAADREADALVVFSSDGAIVSAISGRAVGRAEFERPCCISFDPAGNVWVRNGGDGAPFVGYDLEGSYAGSAGDGVDRILIGPALMFDSAGGPIVRTSRTLVHVPADDWRREYEVARDDDLSAEDLIMVQYPDGRQFPLPQPFGRVPLSAYRHDGHIARASSARYEVVVTDLTGAIAWMASRRREASLLSDAQKDSARTALEPALSHAREAGADSPQIEMPDRGQVLRDIWFDDDGRLWVQLVDAYDGLQQADVWDERGTYLHTVLWPAGVSLSHGAARGNTAWGVAHGEDGAAIVKFSLATG